MHDGSAFCKSTVSTSSIVLVIRLPLPSSRDTTGARLDHDIDSPTTPEIMMVQSHHQHAALGALNHADATSADELQLAHLPHELVCNSTAPDKYGIKSVLALNTTPQPAAVRHAVQSGVTLYEPFGGMCRQQRKQRLQG
jgi:hypothetical protein